MKVSQGDMFERPSVFGRWAGAPPFVVIDVETTGFGYVDRVIEIAMLTVDLDGNVLDQFCTLIDPQQHIPPNVHHITTSDVRGAPTFNQVAKPILDRLRGGIVVAHNLGFEERMLLTEYRRLGTDVPSLVGLDSVPLTKQKYGAGKLDDAARLAGIPIENHHHAQADVVVVAQMLPWIVSTPSSLKWRTAPRPPARLAPCSAMSRSAALPERIGRGRETRRRTS